MAWGEQLGVWIPDTAAGSNVTRSYEVTTGRPACSRRTGRCEVPRNIRRSDSDPSRASRPPSARRTRRRRTSRCSAACNLRAVASSSLGAAVPVRAVPAFPGQARPSTVGAARRPPGRRRPVRSPRIRAGSSPYRIASISSVRNGVSLNASPRTSTVCRRRPSLPLHLDQQSLIPVPRGSGRPPDSITSTFSCPIR